MSGRLVFAAIAAIALVGAVGHATAAAECRQRPRGRPIYRATVVGFAAPSPGAPVPRQILAIYPDGTWTWHGDPAFGDVAPLERAGCVAPAALRELTAALARARFRFVAGPVCAAVNYRKAVIEAPRRGARIVTASPCGRPTDRGTEVLAACAEGVVGDRALDDVRAACRPGRRARGLSLRRPAR
ncbi:MAG: hypothetical protein JNK64_07795 [Myxococcales bacterium]|nr:hypothetical protein [Myxococcales bacterium]